jgi:hypothetical protein
MNSKNFDENDEIIENQICVRMHKELSFNGVKTSILKSGIQKYLRRNNLEKGIWCLVELDLFQIAEVNEIFAKKISLKENLSVKLIQMNAQKIRTNMINRLVAMMSEEISICNWCLPIKIKELYVNWMKTRKTPESRKYLIALYKFLINSEKLRLISDYKTVFNLPPYYIDFEKQSSIHKELLQKHSSKPTINDKISIENVLTNLSKKLENGNDEAFFWLSKLLSNENKTHIKAIWELVFKHSQNKKVCEALQFFFYKMTHKEKWIYLYHAVLLILNKNKIDWTDDIEKKEIVPKEEEIRKYYDFNIARNKIEIDDFILDIHTGLKIKNGLFKFASEGALIIDENKQFLNEEYRKMYIDFKLMIDALHSNNEKRVAKRKHDSSNNCDQTSKTIKLDVDKIIVSFGYCLTQIDIEEESRIEKLPRGQKRTAKYKKSVFIDKFVTFKGPYDFNDQKLLNNLKNAKAILLLEDFLGLDFSTIQDWKRILKTNTNQYYLESENVGKILDNYNCETITSKIETNVLIIKRNTFVKRVSELEKEVEKMGHLECIACLQHLYFRYLLAIGDSGTHNILLKEDKSESLVIGIDLEERNARNVKKSDDKMKKLFKNCSSLQKKIYEPYLKNIKVFENKLSNEQQLKLGEININADEINKRIFYWN